MKQFLISDKGQFYKANLHGHSTCSDGKKTPEELKEIYKSAGYAIYAYTDHDLLIDHSELNDEDFLALTATEVEINCPGEKSFSYRPCYHFCFYHEDQHQVALPCFNPIHVFHNRKDLGEKQAYIGTPDYKRNYYKVNEMLAEYAKHGFIAMLNHPTWSKQTMEDYQNLDTSHIFAMEMYNHSSYVMGYEEENSHIYDELLRKGNKLFCTATDDNHNGHPAGSARWDSLGGFVMIKSEELSQKAIVQALKRGDFYASTGPEIREVYVEDNILHVKTSPAAKIYLTTAVRQAKVVYPASPHTALTEASFDLSDIFPGYVRLTVVDDRGRKAWSQPLFGEFSGKQ